MKKGHIGRRDTTPKVTKTLNVKHICIRKFHNVFFPEAMVWVGPWTGWFGLDPGLDGLADCFSA